MNRRTFLLQSTAAALATRYRAEAQTAAAQPAVAKTSVAQPAAAVLVKTASGILRGSAEGGVNIFRGVPFAQPPVGPLRFRAPMPIASWPGVRDALRFPAAAMQPGEPRIEQSEDCLYLNIWAPQTSGPHPVFVWIHGGGFTGGRAFDPLFDGTQFAREGVVCITVAYRLGVFGFLDLEQQLGPEYAGSANNALRDLILALTWVHGNVAAFGGDPGRVTIGGESAGAKLTDILMGIPSARPLFQGMISESGGAERIWPKDDAAKVGSGFAALWTSDSGKPAAGLKTASATTLIQLQERFTRDWPKHFPLRAEIDGTLIPQAPLQAIQQGSSRGKRLLIGTNRDESALFLGPQPAHEPGRPDLGNLTLDQYRAIEARYRQIYPEMTEPQRWIRSLTAEEYWIPSTRVAEAHVNAGGTAFVYRLDAAPTKGRFSGEAFHSYDLRFVWDHFGQETPSPEDQRLAEEIHAAWLAFIMGKPPQAPGLPTWPAYSTTTRPTMLLNTPSRLENAPQAAELAAWQGLLSS
jgi:para-nitrobenzyl esterase